MSAQPVDVLAAMNKALACFTGKARDKARIVEARAAVAELIEAAPVISENDVADTGHGLIVTLAMTREELDAYRAALARVSGGAA